jgi:hypothetical protein
MLILVSVGMLLSHGYSGAEGEDILYGVTRYLLLYYNPKSITHPSKDIIRLQIKVVTKCNDAKDWTVKEHPNCANVPWSHVITTTEINCSTGQDRDIESVGYNKEGEPAGSSSEETEWSDIAPESNTDTLYHLMCR